MKRVFIILNIFLFIYQSTFCQIGINLMKYDFREIPTLTPEDEAQAKKDGAIHLRDVTIFDYNFYENNDLELWTLNHQTIITYNDTYYDYYKSLSVPYNTDELVAIKARCIKSSGEVFIYTKDQIEDVIEIDENGDEITNKKIKLEKFEKGDIIDYYIITKNPLITSNSLKLQGEVIRKNVEFTLVLPSFLGATTKSYNGLAQPIDSLDNVDNRRYSYIFAPSIKGIKEELMSYPFAYYQRVEYCITHNYSIANPRINSINSSAQNIYNIIGELGKKEVKSLKKIASKIDITKNMNTETKIRTIETYVKENIQLININIDFLGQLDCIESNKFSNANGLMKLYFNLFKKFGIQNELVITTDNRSRKFDKSFDGTNFFSNAMFYFPEIDQYINNEDYYYRLGLTTPFYCNQEGAFLKEISIGENKTFVCDFKTIPALEMEKTTDTIHLQIKIDEKEKMIAGTITRTLNGYYANHIQGNIEDIEIEAKEYIIEELIGLGSENTNVRNEQFINSTSKDIGINPLIMKADISSVEYVTFGKNQITLNVGQLIGEQSELKDCEERQLPIENEFKHCQIRNIEIEIPAGYRCTNLDILDIEIYDNNQKDEAGAGFISSAKIEGNKIIIICSEFYNTLVYPASEFKKIQRVINTAFDFNSKKIIFEKI